MGNVTIDEDDLSDDYDFMDEDDQQAERRRAEKQKNKQPQLKYKIVLQELANRTRDEIIIDLDDLYTVRIISAKGAHAGLMWDSVGATEQRRIAID